MPPMSPGIKNLDGMMVEQEDLGTKDPKGWFRAYCIGRCAKSRDLGLVPEADRVIYYMVLYIILYYIVLYGIAYHHRRTATVVSTQKSKPDPDDQLSILGQGVACFYPLPILIFMLRLLSSPLPSRPPSLPPLVPSPPDSHRPPPWSISLFTLPRATRLLATFPTMDTSV
jgi:hypothetical protein